MIVKIPISIGELIDKISILEIKKSKISDEEKIYNITKEYNQLIAIKNNLNLNQDQLETVYKELLDTNLKLWDIEDNIREFEKNKKFDKEFIELARSVYQENDKRFNLKNKINNLFNSEFIEEKSYQKY